MNDFHKQITLPDLNAGASRTSIPKQIGPYKIDSLLNKGGMSTLYLGVNPETNGPIVIKILLPKFCKNKELAKRFLKEAEIIGMTKHPNIIRLFGQGEWEKGLYIAMEFVQGVSLRQFILQKSLSEKRGLEIIIQVAYALSHLHTHGVIHRDLKPENILITETGEIKVIDFGIAQVKSTAEKERITQKKRLMGTPIYMSPEQKENPSSVSYPSDIYSLGIIAYELLLGRLSHGVIHLNLLPKRLRIIIAKALEIDAKKRYQDIVDFLTDISQYLKSFNQKEISPESNEEIVHIVQNAKKILMPETPPKWPQLDISMAHRDGNQMSGLYIDFFQLKRGRYALLIAKSREEGIASLLSASIFRGMVHLGMQLDEKPMTILDQLNQTLSKDPIKHPIQASFLFLTPETNQLIFISCDYTNLFSVAESSHSVRTLSTPNPAIGEKEGPVFIELADNWAAGDTLILHSQASHKPNNTHWIEEHLLLSGKPRAEKMLDHLIGQDEKQEAALLTINRIF